MHRKWFDSGGRGVLMTIDDAASEIGALGAHHAKPCHRRHMAGVRRRLCASQA